ncbi:hypothetical protein B9Q11_03115 [Candidatus Marsarchaeota G2 archaeon ECH_B_SAG-F08]|jgi:hypothetical protein|uniref:Uncharacterized protein n=6 Tax=Candidatus Marsarchaeota TaxID=1978152 RepID=A0A2R6BZA6_9ARCH|nr:MAG: hypothetical protein B9Q02_12220 [Candidatus Marsarchaeota G1 archaeon BE_D]PSN82096.1 MAG: hypothetical protein B9Q01_09025 [Candidatus Marsarchaeota G1 archaeon OSP_D]PSN87463.1 MAG: hypothetical protein B9Q00_08780 [Candidatus Marsarchaeota G1 archaeon OSP_C]PSN98021.1 MAG: hypothetical protein B9Q11_03115 [Candidatus Marsarchaeota G2 archaeon ECH_B_SAG-F08]PSO03955.1 MAG: hypothetical protein B9Q12_03335 [Candidatus Marsarchaeota G2 archaeon ECH_B_SAG-G06]PSO05939.1 MAG: hypothetic
MHVLITFGLASLAALIGLIILWIIVSIPVYFAAKLVTGGKSGFAQAMLATLIGPIVFAIVLAISSFFLGVVVGASATVLALFLAFLAWLAVYKGIFGTGWLGAFGIAVIAVVIYAVLDALFVSLFSVRFPGQSLYPLRI